MKTVTQKSGESRKDYLVRVAIEMLRENASGMGYIIFDDAECDAWRMIWKKNFYRG